MTKAVVPAYIRIFSDFLVIQYRRRLCMMAGYLLALRFGFSHL